MLLSCCKRAAFRFWELPGSQAIAHEQKLSSLRGEISSDSAFKTIPQPREGNNAAAEKSRARNFDIVVFLKRSRLRRQGDYFARSKRLAAVAFG